MISFLKPKKKYNNIFFDLDRTLWDLETNADHTLREIYKKYNLERFIPGYADFAREYSKINNRLWAEYTAGNIKKERLRELRFYKTLKLFGVNDAEMGKKLDKDYTATCPYKSVLFPYAKELLTYLSAKYKLYIITNGFSEIQDIKLASGGIDHFFGKVYTSEKIGYAKPDARIFKSIMEELATTPDKCIMVGDDWAADIRGAQNAGIDQIFFNPDKNVHDGKPTYEVVSLKEIEKIL